MKWIGWILALLVGLVAFLYVQAHTKDEKDYEKQLRKPVDQQYVSALNALKSVEAALPQMEKRLAAEKTKTAELAKQNQTLEAEKQGLETQVAELAREVEALSVRRESHAAKRQQDSQEVKDLQAKITRLKLDVEKLKELILTVTETSDLP